jgi:hypothetical protein
MPIVPTSARRFHLHEGVLHLDLDPVHAAPPPRLSTDRAWARLAAEALDGVTSLDGTRALQRRWSYGATLGEALAVLVAHGAEVRTRRDARTAPGVYCDGDDRVRVRVTGHELRRALAGAPRLEEAARTAGADEQPRHRPGPDATGFELEVRGGAPPPRALVAPDDAGWQWAVRGREASLRLGCTAKPRDYEVCLYRCGVLWQREAVAAVHGGPGCRLAIDVVCASSEEPLLPIRLPSPPTAEGVRAVAAALLDPRHARAWSRSALARAVLSAVADDWRDALRSAWREDADDDDRLVDVACDADTCDELLALVDALAVLARRCADDDATLALHGRCAARRLLACGRGPTRFARLPCTKAQLARLHAAGAAPSPHALLCDGRRLLLPADATLADDLPRALAAVVGLDAPAVATSASSSFPSERVLCFDALHLEDGAEKEVRAPPVRAYELEHCEAHAAIVLRVVADEARVDAGEALSADEAVEARLGSAHDDEEEEGGEAHPRKKKRRRAIGALAPDEARFAALFPRTARRLAAQRWAASAVWREAQARRARAGPWSLEELDCGANASALGLAVLVAAALQWGRGVRARVYASGDGGAALVGVRRHGAWVLVDVARTDRSAFALDLVTTDEAPPRKGALIEVRGHRLWQLAQVETVDASGVAIVRLAGSGRRLRLDLRAETWRPLVRSPDGDAEELVRKLLPLRGGGGAGE